MTTESTPAHGTSESITEKPAAAPPDATSTAITLAPAAPAPAAPTPAVDPGPPVWMLRTDLLLLALLLLMSFFVASFAASNSELWMHLAIGKRISEGTFEFGVDPFSWATQADGDQPAVRWVHHSWLYSWLVYQIYQLGNGGAILVFGKALLFTIAIGLLTRIGWTAPNRWFLLICLLMAVLAASHRLLLEPTVFSLLFLSITLYVLNRAGVFAIWREGLTPTDVRCLWALPPLFALWANLDAWFILGPMVVGLCWASAAFGRWFPSVRGLPARTLGLVFGVGLLACVLNPQHVYVFQLPPELAYLVLAVADPLHIPVPAHVVAAGRTLKVLRTLEPGFEWTMSSVTSNYYWDTRRGKNIAGIALFPLLLLGLLAFALMAAMVKPQKDAPSLHIARFLVWLVFGVMALALYRLIPFFVLVAAPMTALTLSEFLQWQQANSTVSPEKRDRGLKLARLVSVPFFLLLLYLAWPGWLHGPTDFNSPRRVNWLVRENPSLKNAALTLQALKDKGEGHNVFNADRDLGNVLPWFAPDVKYAMDSRYALYAQQTTPLAKVREALLSDKQDGDWPALFAKHNVDQIAMRNFLTNESRDQVVRWWLAPAVWRQRFGDLRVVVLSWSGSDANKRWTTGSVSDDLNRAAFGTVPADKRPPAKGTPLPQGIGALTLYLDGIPPTPTSLGEIEVLRERYRVVTTLAHQQLHPVPLLGLAASLTAQQCIPGAAMNLDSAYVSLLIARASCAEGGEIGPPAIPVLVVRTARQAVAENPLDARTYIELMNANETLRRVQEDRWINYQPQRGPHPAVLRDRLRQTQQMSGAFTAVQLQPDSYFHHDRLAKLYLQQNLFDFALEHFQIAEKLLEAQRPSGAEAVKQFEALVKGYRGEIANLDKDIKQRQSKWKEVSTGKSPLLKAILAYQASFLGRPMGLGKKALETLDTIEAASLKPEEGLPFVRLRYDLLLSMGRADLVSKDLDNENVKKNLPADVYAQYRLFAAAAAGDYDAVDESLAKINASLRASLEANRAAFDERHREFAIFLFSGGTQPTVSALTFLARPAGGIMHVNHPYLEAQLIKGTLANNRTLNGILLLEAGRTKDARDRFQAAMADSDDLLFFTERPIARRYLELLDQQKP